MIVICIFEPNKIAISKSLIVLNFYLNYFNLQKTKTTLKILTENSGDFLLFAIKLDDFCI